MVGFLFVFGFCGSAPMRDARQSGRFFAGQVICPAGKMELSNFGFMAGWRREETEPLRA
jgi:hypothetical protein